MSKLDEQLLELQTKKLKAEFLKLLKSKIGDVTNDKFKNIEKDIKDLLFAFVDAQIDMIESGEIQQEAEVKNVFSSDEVEVLKLLASRAASKTLQTSNKPTLESAKKLSTTNKPDLSTQDKIKFAQGLRHLGGKEVKIKDGSSGKVVGLDAPYVVVQLYNGVAVSVLPDELII